MKLKNIEIIDCPLKEEYDLTGRMKDILINISFSEIKELNIHIQYKDYNIILTGK
tara:strand:- start:439 stop:603 length:165 start_codon:yes stop_codon:yes gene_type:complete